MTEILRALFIFMSENALAVLLCGATAICGGGLLLTAGLSRHERRARFALLCIAAGAILGIAGAFTFISTMLMLLL